MSKLNCLWEPGKEYAQTRHNASVEAPNWHFKADPKFYGISGRGNIEGQDVRLLLPTTFMNASKVLCPSKLSSPDADCA